MKNWTVKVVKLAVICGVLFVQFNSLTVFAGDSGTVLPGTTKTVKDCKELLNEVEMLDDAEKRRIFTGEIVATPAGGSSMAAFSSAGSAYDPSDVLGCGIKTGQIRLWMVPYYIRYILQFVIGIGGLIAVGGIVYGGYLYLFAGISEDKDKGKKAIIYGVSGMVMTLVAWVVVNIIIGVVTA